MSDRADDDMFEDDDVEEEQVNGHEAAPQHGRRYQDEDDEDEEDEEEDEDDEEEEEEATAGRKPKRQRRHKRDAVSRFIDAEAEVEDEDEEDEDEEEYGADEFIDAAVEDDEGTSRQHHALLDRRRNFEEAEDQTPEQIARDLSRRYARTGVRYNGDMNTIPQRLLMPSVHDASLWQVRVKPGREKDIVFSLMRKAMDVEYTAHPLQILSAFQRDSLPGMIYVEARSAKQVITACNGLVGVYPSRGVHLVPIEEMASLLTIKKQDVAIVPGTWVRIRRGKYAGDLAQVMDTSDNGEDVGIRFIPRIDFTPRDDASVDGVRKRKKAMTGVGALRPPQRLFNVEEVIKHYGPSAVARRREGQYVFQSETYKDGFMEKDFKPNALILEDVKPTLDEITQFARSDSQSADGAVDLSVIAESSRKAAVAVLQPGDHIEVFEGEQAGVHGVVEQISKDVVTITASGLELEGQKIDLPARSVRKKFKPGDHVKVMTGKNADETGLVVSVSNNVVTFLSDMSLQEISVFSKDLREAAEVGSSTNIVGEYELHDLVQLDPSTVGVIFKTERDSFRVLDQSGQVRLVQPHQISARGGSNRSIATDSEGHELRREDMMKEIDGEGRTGRVLHVHQSFFAFLHNREITQNDGVFVTRCRSLKSLAPRSNIMKTATGADLSKMNPAMAIPAGGMVGSTSGRGPRDRLIGTNVVICKGPQKGIFGLIKDMNGPTARVELSTNNKVITIDREKLLRRLPNGSTEKLDARPQGNNNGKGGFNNNNGGFKVPSTDFGRTPNPYAGNKTPNPYADNSSRTPAWNAGAKTPNPYAAGSATPAWNASSKTPNPYAAGNATPAWNASSKTPNPYANAGNATPRWGASGGQTPGRSAWGGGSGQAWGNSSPPRDTAATPWSSETFQGAPTPGAAFGNTPSYGDVATPGYTPWGNSFEQTTAPTPGVGTSNIYNAYTSASDVYSAPSDWFVDAAFLSLQDRLLVKIEGTRVDGYLDSNYEGKTGRIMGAHKSASKFDQTALVAFDEPVSPNEPSRSILGKYIVPLGPTAADEEALVLDGDHKGDVVRVRTLIDETLLVSSEGAFFEISGDRLVKLAPA